MLFQQKALSIPPLHATLMGAYHQCGIAAVSSKEQDDLKQSVVYLLYKLLLSMQNRGQLSAGITTYNAKREQLLDTHKDIGLVNDVFRTNHKIKRMNIMKNYMGTEGIGHVRYATCGADDVGLAQPFERHHGRLWKWFSFCFNGNIANVQELKDTLLQKEGYHIVRDSDTEVLMHYLARQLRGPKVPDLVEVFGKLSAMLDGCYNIAFIDAAGRIVVLRDPMGIRPIAYGRNNGSVIAASETNALASCGVYEPKFLQPGEMLLIKDGQYEVKQYAKSPRKAHCMFEWVYFANVASIIDGVSVYKVRKNLGIHLAKVEPLEIDKDTIIVPVPETSKTVTDSMAFELGTSTQDGLIRNRFLGRTFIEGKDRADRVRNKFTVLSEIMEGKKVILVDDSIVRGTTSKMLIKYIKEVGRAKEVHMRISCPPIMAPCFYGIDMSTISELFAPNFNSVIDEELPQKVLDKMAKDIGADSLIYQKHSALVDAIGFPKKDLCMACLNGEYPTKSGKKLYCQALENWKAGKKGRTYEC